METRISHLIFVIRKSRYMRIGFSAVVMVAAVAATVYGQKTPTKDIHAVARKDGRAFVYHAQTIPLSHGFYVYRSLNGKNWTQLNKKPVYPATNGYEFRQMVGDDYQKVKAMTDAQTPQGVFLRLRSGTSRGILASFTLPSLAQAVGRLYVDKNAPIGKSVYYRFQILNDRGQPTGDTFKGKTKLNPKVPPAPTNLEVDHKNRKVTLNWHYVPNGTPKAQNVIRFQIFYRQSGDDSFQLANPEFIARTIEKTDYHYIFNVPEAGEQYDFMVKAVDFTGRPSPQSKIKTASISENVPPEIIKNVQVRAASDYTSQLTWPVSTDLDIEGYFIYRSKGTDRKKYTQLNDEPIPPLTTAYKDSSLTPGTKYRYKVAAIDTAGNIGPKSNPAHVLIGDYRQPDSVSSFTAEYHSDGVHLKWDRPSIPAGLNTYLLLRRKSNPATAKAFTAIKGKAFTDSSYVDSGQNGKHFVDAATYQYGVAVVAQNGQSSDTVFTSVRIPDRTPPESPGFIKADMREGHRVSLRWNASSSNDVTHYRVYRKAQTSNSDTLLAELSLQQRYFRDRSVPLSRTFIYTVQAVDSVGNVSKNPPRDTLVTHRLHPPAPARNVQAVQMNKGVTIAWNASGDEQVASYHIYRSNLATGVYKKIGKVTADTTRWVDLKGKPGLWYKVYPTDAAGREARTAEAAQAINRDN